MLYRDHQDEIAQDIPDRGSHFALAVKHDQGRLYHDLADLLMEAVAAGLDDLPYEYANQVNNHIRHQ